MADLVGADILVAGFGLPPVSDAVTQSVLRRGHAGLQDLARRNRVVE